MCNHAYVVPSGIAYYCLECKEIVDVKLLKEKQYKQLVMPPEIYSVTEELWERIKPWKVIPYSVVKQGEWYITLIRQDEYLIMPVCRGGQKVFYSARRLTNCGGPKYNYPLGVKRSPWCSWSDTPKSETIIICEGVADAAYCSLFADSVALLGNYYDHSLDTYFHNRNVIIALDGDAVGIISAARISQNIAKKVSDSSVRICVFPDGKEPTDYTVDGLKEALYG